MSAPWIGEIASNACPVDDLETLKQTISSPTFKHFAREAYKSRDGYSIRMNPVTRKIEMFVAGTRDINQWILNAYDGLLHAVGVGNIQILDIWRYKKQNQLAKIAKANNVDIVYGHSRGGAIVADMPLTKCTQRVGLDAAMMIAKNKNILNLNEGGGINPTGLFDEYIGQTGKRNLTIDYSPWVPHKVWKV